MITGKMAVRALLIVASGGIVSCNSSESDSKRHLRFSILSI